MSTTTKVPCHPVSARITLQATSRSGSPVGGVRHPSTHDADAGPRLGGGRCGVGGVAASAGDGEAIGRITGDDEGAGAAATGAVAGGPVGVAAPPREHDAASAAAIATAAGRASVRILCNRRR